MIFKKANHILVENVIGFFCLSCGHGPYLQINFIDQILQAKNESIDGKLLNASRKCPVLLCGNMSERVFVTKR